MPHHMKIVLRYNSLQPTCYDLSILTWLRAGPGGRAVKGVGFGRLITGIVVSNPVRGIDVCLCVSVLCFSVEVEAFAKG
jgi:hypothetical protein